MILSDKESVNILVELIAAHGVTDAVICPGSRNAPIARMLVSNLERCHSVVDERSAGFKALGMALATNRPVAVCVTSGSAMLNLAPAVAEAKYQHVGLIVITADRPAAEINQLRGQTLEQPGGFGQLVKKCINLPEASDSNALKYCNRLVNEVLLETQGFDKGPVHINVPLQEPLFGTSDGMNPPQHVIKKFISSDSAYVELADKIAKRFMRASRPMVVMGQYRRSEVMSEALAKIADKVIVLNEPLSSENGGNQFDVGIKIVGEATEYKPDFVLYAGDTTVSRRIVSYIASAPGAESWEITEDGQAHDVFGNLVMLAQADAEATMRQLAVRLGEMTLMSQAEHFHKIWSDILRAAQAFAGSGKKTIDKLAVQTLEGMLGNADGFDVYYANSTAVRLGCIFARHYIYVNRGVNGIEGSLSTAVGASMVNRKPTVCVIGDLSFMYDANALWQSDDCDLRVLLLNNKGGGIFRKVAGMPLDETGYKYVMAEHNADAKGICESFGVEYIAVTDEGALNEAISKMLDVTERRRIVVEVFDTPAQVNSIPIIKK